MALWYDEATGECETGSPTCVLPEPSDGPSAVKEILMPYQCTVDNQNCGPSSLNAEISSLVPEEDKSHWLIRGSSSIDGNVLNMIKDNNVASSFVSDQADQFPWVEVVLESSQIVNAVELKG